MERSLWNSPCETLLVTNKTVPERKRGFAQPFLLFRLSAEAQQTHNDSGSEAGSQFLHAFDERGVTPLPHAPGARMVVVTQTSSHEPARQPASQASQPAILPPSQRTRQPPSQPASHSQPASGGRRCGGRFKGPFQVFIQGRQFVCRSKFGQIRQVFENEFGKFWKNTC